MKREKVKKQRMSVFDSEYVHDAFESYKLSTAVLNLISSKFLEAKPILIMKFFTYIMGESEAEKMFLEDNGVAAKLEESELEELNDRLIRVEKRAAISFLKRRSRPFLTQYIKDIQFEAHRSPLFNRLQVIRNMFKLTEIETDMLIFVYLLKHSAAKDILTMSHTGFDFENAHRFRVVGNIPLGISRGDWLRSFQHLSAKSHSILDVSSHDISIDDDIGVYLSGVGTDDYQSSYFTTENDERLTLCDFSRSAEELAILDSLFSGNKGFNILLYGVPGAGKSSFARALVKHYARELMTVKSPKDQDHRDFIRAIGASSVLASDNSVLLVDEADEVLNSWNSALFKSETKKSWINNFLDSHGKKILWIVNRSSEIDISTMRRFTFTLEFKNLNEKRRIHLLERELQQRELLDKVPVEEIKALCRTYSVNADGVLKAVSLVDWEKEKDPIKAVNKVSCILENHEKAIGRRVINRRDEKRFTGYSVSALNTSCDLTVVISAAQNFVELSSSANRLSFTMLLHGQPGTGKTEFVNYLGHILGKSVLLKRASDIISMWVGGTEQNIAEAFESAREENGILFFDEADSFLYPRQDAVRSWEKTQTNELLTQLENASGIVVFATNFMDGLDHAALRRFHHKIEFRPLSPDGILKLYSAVLSAIAGNEPLNAQEKSFLQAMNNLTPGDFKVVRDQFAYSDAPQANDTLIKALAQELSYKQNTKGPIGFRAAV